VSADHVTADRSRAFEAPEAERALLGALLRWPEALCEVAPDLRADDFHSDAHRRLYRTIVSRWDAGKPIDLVTIADDLKAAGDVANIGGYAYLAELCESAGTGAWAPTYAAAIRDKAVRRNLFDRASEIMRDAQSPAGSTEQILADSERKIMSVSSRSAGGSTISFAESLRARMDEINERSIAGQRVCGVPTGFIDLDKLTAGLHPSELIIVAARPSIGKTAWAMAVARHAVGAEMPVLFASLEQSHGELSERFLCMESRLDSHRVRTSQMRPEEVEQLMDAYSRLAGTPLEYYDEPQQTTLRIASQARRMKQKKGLGLVVVDYLQLIEPEDPRAKRYEQVGVDSRRLKLLAKELNVPVLCMAQLNRAAEDRVEPKLRDLRESGSIEQDADVVVLMHRLEEGGSTNRILCNVAKNRNGRCGRVELTFVRHCTRFETAGIPA
jgi:replicative DNA helicase